MSGGGFSTFGVSPVSISTALEASRLKPCTPRRPHASRSHQCEISDCDAPREDESEDDGSEEIRSQDDGPPPPPSKRPTELLDLPNELLAMIMGHSSSLEGILHFRSTNRRLATIFDEDKRILPSFIKHCQDSTWRSASCSISTMLSLTKRENPEPVCCWASARLQVCDCSCIEPSEKLSRLTSVRCLSRMRQWAKHDAQIVIDRIGIRMCPSILAILHHFLWQYSWTSQSPRLRALHHYCITQIGQYDLNAAIVLESLTGLAESMQYQINNIAFTNWVRLFSKPHNSSCKKHLSFLRAQNIHPHGFLQVLQISSSSMIYGLQSCKYGRYLEPGQRMSFTLSNLIEPMKLFFTVYGRKEVRSKWSLPKPVQPKLTKEYVLWKRINADIPRAWGKFEDRKMMKTLVRHFAQFRHLYECVTLEDFESEDAVNEGVFEDTQ